MDIEVYPDPHRYIDISIEIYIHPAKAHSSACKAFEKRRAGEQTSATLPPLAPPSVSCLPNPCQFPLCTPLLPACTLLPGPSFPLCPPLLRSLARSLTIVYPLPRPSLSPHAPSTLAHPHSLYARLTLRYHSSSNGCPNVMFSRTVPAITHGTCILTPRQLNVTGIRTDRDQS